MAVTLKSVPAKWPAPGAGATPDEDGHYSDEHFGDHPFQSTEAVATAATAAAGLGSIRASRTNTNTLRSMSTLPEGFRMAGLAPPDLPGKDVELKDFTSTLVSQVGATAPGVIWNGMKQMANPTQGPQISILVIQGPLITLCCTPPSERGPAHHPLLHAPHQS